MKYDRVNTDRLYCGKGEEYSFGGVDFLPAPWWLMAIIAFLVPAVIFFVFRINLFPIINSDAAFTFYDYHNKIDVNIFSVFNSKYHQNNFRPLNILLWSNIADLYALYGERYHKLVVLGVACLNGLLSLTIYGVCFNYCKNRLTSLFSSFLYSFSLAGICSSWHNLFAAFMLGPLLLTCGAIFAYQKFRSLISKWRWFWLGVLILLCLAAPWFREVGYIPAIVIFILELVRLIRQRSLFILIPGVLTAHALMPKVIPWLMGLYDGPVKILGTEGHASSLSITNIRHIISGLIINEVPPLLWFLIIIPAIAYSTVVLIPNLWRKSYWAQQFTPPNMVMPDETGQSEKRQPLFIKIMGLCVGIVIVVVLLILIHPVFNVDLGMTEREEKILPTFFLLAVVTLTALRFGILFPIWFVLGAVVPFLMGVGQELHNGYAMSALAIICALYSRELMKVLSKLRITVVRQLLIGMATLGVILAVADQIGNVPTSYLNLNNINLMHQKVAFWLSENAPEGSYIFADFYAANDIAFRTSYPSNKYIFRPIPYEYRSAPSVEVQLDCIKKAQDTNQRVFYVHLRNFTTDIEMLHPAKFLEERVVFDLNIFTFALDPLRFFVDSRKYPRRFAPCEWNTCYGWLGYSYGTNLCTWPVEIVVYELPMDKVADLDSSSFVNIRPKGVLREWGWGPIIEGCESDNGWTNLHAGWNNNVDTSIVPYEKFRSSGPDNIIQAVNTTGIGVANTPGFNVTAGRQYEITFDMVKASGVHPTFRISEDPFGNTSPLFHRTGDGRANYVFDAPQTRTYYAVLE